MTEKLSVLIAIKNHRDLMRGCVASVLEVADELLIADSGSTDGTAEVARELAGEDCKVKVVARDYRTACSFKNWGIAQATHPWVLIIDVDERLTEQLAAEIKALLACQSKGDGYWITRDNHFLGQRVRFAWGRDRVIRIFRRDAFRYPDESADHGEFPTRGLKVKQLRAPMVHLVRSSYDEHLEKLGRYTSLQARRWKAQGRESSYLQLLVRPPLRFLRSYVIYGGFLDGIAGLQVAYLAAFSAFFKQARLWELNGAKDESDHKQAALPGDPEKRKPPIAA